jgi:hypothetical protein
VPGTYDIAGLVRNDTTGAARAIAGSEEVTIEPG